MAGKTLSNRWWFLTIAAAFAAGWALAPADRSAKTAAASLPARNTKSSRQRESLDRSNPSARLVWTLLEEMDAAESPDSVAPAADRAAAARAAIDAWVGDGADKQLLAEARIRFAHWLESDPKAAIVYWNGSGRQESVEMLAAVARDHLVTMDPAEILNWVSANPEIFRGPASYTLLRVLADTCAAGKNVALLERGMAEMDTAAAQGLLFRTMLSWPSGDVETLEECLRKSPDPIVVGCFVSRLEPARVVSWVRNEIATNGSLAGILKSNNTIASALASAHGASISERLAFFEEISASVGGLPGSRLSPATLVSIDVSNWLAQTDAAAGPLTDWRQRLRLGEIGASQIMDEASRAMPGVAGEQPDEFRKRMFNEMVAINPTSAMELISDQPLQKREAAMIAAGMGVAGQADPQHLLELVSTMPPTRATSPQERFQVWSRAAAPSYAKYGESYVSWVTAMPPGIERDWALSGLSGHFLALDPEKSAYLKSLKTLPAGWRPEK